MGRPSNKVPPYLHHKSGRARVRSDGRDIYLGKFGSDASREKYARVIAEHFGNGQRRTISVVLGEVLSVAALVVKYVDHAVDKYRKNGEMTSQVERIRAAVCPLVKLCGSPPGNEFRLSTLKTVGVALAR